MRTFNWLACVTLLSVLVFADAAYSGTPGEFKGTTITILAGDHPGFNALRKIIPDFEKEYGITVRVDQVDALAVYNKIMLSGEKSDYDLVMVDCQYLPEYVKKNRLSALDELAKDRSLVSSDFNMSDLVPIYVKLLSTEGKWYSMPLSGETALYFYRKDIYAKYGLKPAADWETLLQQVKLIHEKEKGNGLYGWAWRTKGSGYTPNLLMSGFGGQWFQDDDPHKTLLLDSKPNLEAFRYFGEAIKYMPPGGAAYGYAEAAAAFQQLKVAVFIDASNIQYYLDPQYSRLTPDTMGWALIPLNPGSARKSPAAGWGLSITAGSEHKRPAFKFLEYQVSKANDKRLVDAGRMPNLISTHVDPEMVKKYPYLPAVWEALKYGNLEFRPRIPEWGKIYSLEIILTNEMANGIKPADVANKEFHTKVRAILTEAGYYK